MRVASDISPVEKNKVRHSATRFISALTFIVSSVRNCKASRSACRRSVSHLPGCRTATTRRKSRLHRAPIFLRAGPPRGTAQSAAKTYTAISTRSVRSSGSTSRSWRLSFSMFRRTFAFGRASSTLLPPYNGCAGHRSNCRERAAQASTDPRARSSSRIFLRA